MRKTWLDLLRKNGTSNIVLMGPPGCGKTEFGKNIWKYPIFKDLNGWIDVDDHVLEPAWNTSVAERLKQVGDEKFLDLEAEEVCKMNYTRHIISLSGSVPLRSKALQHLKSNHGIIIFLDAPIEDIIKRAEQMKVDRIVGMSKSGSLEEELKRRFEIYENSYDYRFVIGKNENKEQIIKNLVQFFSKSDFGLYFSTRGGINNKNTTESFHTVLFEGLAKDKGLYTTNHSLPFNGNKEFERLIDLSYDKLCSRVIEKFNTISPWRIKKSTKEAYSSFSHPDILPINKINKNIWMLETFHGPTGSFKDFSLQFLPKLFKHSLEENKDNDQYKNPAILVATSGDTGSAALHGFGRTKGTPIVVLYPNHGVSSVQKAQMVRAPGNVCVLGINDNFDYCQKVVKELLNNSSDLSDNYSWTSANSINFARILPQICFTFQSYLSLVRKKVISFGDPIDVTIPTGNFGNIFSAIYAKKMGIPIRKLVCASNDNNVLTEFINTGKYSIQNRKFKNTISPAIDILISSNLERWIYMLYQDSYQSLGLEPWKSTTLLMDQLASDGFFTINKEIHDDIKQSMVADWCSEIDCLQTIKNVWNNYNTLIDPHSAVGYHVASKFNDPDVPMVVVGTAHWAKFPEVIIEALSSNNPSPGNISSHSLSLGEQYEKIQKLAPSVGIPKHLFDLTNSPPIHNTCLDANIDNIRTAIKNYISNYK